MRALHITVFMKKIRYYKKTFILNNLIKNLKNPINTYAIFYKIFGFDVLQYYFTTKILQNIAMCKAL